MTPSLRQSPLLSYLRLRGLRSELFEALEHDPAGRDDVVGALDRCALKLYVEIPAAEREDLDTEGLALDTLQEVP